MPCLGTIRGTALHLAGYAAREVPYIPAGAEVRHGTARSDRIRRAYRARALFGDVSETKVSMRKTIGTLLLVAPFVAVVLYAAVMIGRDMWIVLGFTVITMCCIGVGAYLLTSSED